MDAIQSSTRPVIRRQTRKLVPKLPDIDGRSRMARQHREAIKHIRQQIRLIVEPTARMTKSERAAVERCAWLQVLADTAAARALAGSIPVSDATRAAGQAARSLERLRDMFEGY